LIYPSFFVCTSFFVLSIFPLCIPALPQAAQYQLLRLVRCYVSPPAVTVNKDDPIHEVIELEAEQRSSAEIKHNSPAKVGEKASRWMLADGW